MQFMYPYHRPMSSSLDFFIIYYRLKCKGVYIATQNGRTVWQVNMDRQLSLLCLLSILYHHYLIFKPR